MSVDENNSSGVGAPLGNDNAVENSGGAPLGNTNAVGNSGGGAPEGNANRKSHGVYCELEKIDHRAEGEIAEFIDRMETAIQERADGEPGEIAREIPLRVIRFDRAARDIQCRGLIVDRHANTMLSTARRISDGVFDDLGKLGVLRG